MKVTEVKNVPVRTDSGGVSLFVRIETDAGIHGLGEVGTSSMGRAIMEAVDHLAEVVVGSDPWETERLWQLMFRGNFFPADRVYGCAISAIDIALWDIKGKSVDMPVYKLLGGTSTQQSRLLSTHSRRDQRGTGPELPRTSRRRLEIRPVGPTRNLWHFRSWRHLPTRTRRIDAASRRTNVNGPRSRWTRNPDSPRCSHSPRHRARRSNVQGPRRVQTLLH